MRRKKLFVVIIIVLGASLGAILSVDLYDASQNPGCFGCNGAFDLAASVPSCAALNSGEACYVNLTNSGDGVFTPTGNCTMGWAGVTYQGVYTPTMTIGVRGTQNGSCEVANESAPNGMTIVGTLQVNGGSVPFAGTAS